MYMYRLKKKKRGGQKFCSILDIQLAMSIFVFELTFFLFLSGPPNIIYWGLDHFLGGVMKISSIVLQKKISKVCIDRSAFHLTLEEEPRPVCQSSIDRPICQCLHIFGGWLYYNGFTFPVKMRYRDAAL